MVNVKWVLLLTPYNYKSMLDSHSIKSAAHMTLWAGLMGPIQAAECPCALLPCMVLCAAFILLYEMLSIGHAAILMLWLNSAGHCTP